MSDEWLQRLGSYMQIFMAISLWWVSSQIKAWCHYGKETAAVVASFLFIVALIRVGRTEFGWYDVSTATVLNAYVSVAHGAILAVVVGLHLMRHRYLRECTGKQCKVNDVVTHDGGA